MGGSGWSRLWLRFRFHPAISNICKPRGNYLDMFRKRLFIIVASVVYHVPQRWSSNRAIDGNGQMGLILQHKCLITSIPLLLSTSFTQSISVPATCWCVTDAQAFKCNFSLLEIMLDPEDDTWTPQSPRRRSLTLESHTNPFSGTALGRSVCELLIEITV